MGFLFDSFRSFSLRGLMILGFALSVMPLVLALVSVMYYVEDLAELSHRTVHQVASESRQSRNILDLVGMLERRGKQLQVFGDPATWESFQEAHREFTETATAIAQSSENGPYSALIGEMTALEKQIYESLSGNDPLPSSVSGKTGKRNPNKLANPAEAFQQLRAKAAEFTRNVSEHVNSEAEQLTSRLHWVQHRLALESLILVPVGLGITSFFLVLLIRPVRRIDQAIRNLGSGDLDTPIQIDGPKDLRFLGERLDWLRTRLISLEQAKHRFVRNVSHEIKTPLANLHEGVALLSEEVVGELNPEQKDIAKILMTNAQKLEHLIFELIRYGELSEPKRGETQRRLDLGSLIGALLRDYQLRFRAKALIVEASLEAIQIVGNPEQIRTVVDNLLSNAVKYSPISGRISLSLSTAGEYAELEIEDEGPGIPPDERTLVFEPLFQGRASREFDVKGSGFGLAIAAECVVAHHGHIAAIDPRPGRHGARIRVQLPRLTGTSYE